MSQGRRRGRKSPLPVRATWPEGGFGRSNTAFEKNTLRAAEVPLSEQSTRPASRTSSRPSSRTSSRPSSRSKPFFLAAEFSVGDASYQRWVAAKTNLETIVVKEEDLRRYGHDKRKLRECQLRTVKDTPALDHNEVKELSFQAAFKQRCLSEGKLQNPWQKLENPDLCRPTTDSDLIVNQVWEATARRNTLAVPKLEVISPNGSSRTRSVSTRASSDDPLGLPHQPGARKRRTRHRSASRGADTEAGSTSRMSSSSQGATLRSTAPLPKVESRIRQIDESELRSLGPLRINDPSRHERNIDAWLLERQRSRKQALWVAVDPSGGHVHVFPRAVANRLEASHRDRLSAPLAGLGDASFEASIVFFGHGAGDEGYVERRPDGHRDVRRLEVVGLAQDVVVHVLPPGRPSNESCNWRIVDNPIPGQSEDRVVLIYNSHLVTPPGPKQHEVKERKQSFLNFAAFEQN